MKSLLTTMVCAIALIASTTALSGQEVPTKQKPLFTKITATWCPNCGTWGWTYMKNIIEDNEDDALIIGAHHSGDLASPSAGFLEENFGTFSQPRFIFGNVDQGVTRSNIADKTIETKDLVQAAIRQEARIGVGLEASISDEEIVVKSKTQSFEALVGEYYLALYVVEDKVIANQSSVGPDAEHPFVLRAGFAQEEFGEELFNGTASDFEKSGEHTLSISPGWNTENIHVYGIIWRKEDNTYIYENGNSVKVAQGSTSSADHGVLAEVKVFPTISTGEYNVQVPSELIADLEVDVRDLSGQKVPNLQRSTSGQISLDLNEAAAGYYLIHLKHEKGRRTFRVLKQ